MRRDVFLAPSAPTPTALGGRVPTVIDVLRATTTIAARRHAGARTGYHDRAMFARALSGTGG